MTGSAGSAEKVTLIVVEGAKTAGKLKQCRRLFFGISALASSTRRDASPPSTTTFIPTSLALYRAYRSRLILGYTSGTCTTDSDASVAQIILNV